MKENLKDYVNQITRPSKGKNMYICPLCGSGTGKNATGAFSITDDGKNWKCFSCEESGDIFDLIGKVQGITDYTEQKQALEDIYTTPQRKKPVQRKTEPLESEEEEADYTDLFLQANDVFIHPDKYKVGTNYHTKRGLSEEIIKKFNLGYIPNWRHPKAPENVPTSPRFIIPTSKSSYLARDTRDLKDIPNNQKNYTKSKVGKTQIFNLEALKEATKPVYIVEGEIDAMSIEEVGGHAIALGGVSNINKLLEILSKEKPEQPLILALDTDKTGKQATETLENGLKELGIFTYRHNPSGTYKDPNEALTSDREAFKQAVEAGEVEPLEMKELEKEEYLKNSSYNHIQKFIDGIEDSANTPSIKTGFKALDMALDGGLYEGLYFIGAISSLGKTTFVLQMADQIAQSGQDVLIFSLEMARTELMAKSISRHTIKLIEQTGGEVRHAKTSRGITTGKRYKDYSKPEMELINSAIKEYSTYADRIYISEGVGDIGVNEIRETVEKHIRITGNTPIVIIDYLQILAPYSERMSDKQNTDKATLELKRISRDFKIPIIGISSFNRDNYNNKVSMISFKESGAIEYSSDILIGLQLKGAGEKDFNVDEAKDKNPREVELKILKSRNSRTGLKIDFSYYPMFNYFKEA